MPTDVITWRYYLAPTDGPPADSWSVVFVDSTGSVAVLSDYGHYSFRWHTPHTGKEDFRDFLVDCGADYIANKLGRTEDTQAFDGEATEKRIRDHIAERARKGHISTVAARREHERLPTLDDALDFERWAGATKIREPHLLAVYGRTGHFDHWVRVSLPRLQAAIRTELRLEREQPRIANELSRSPP